MNNKKSRKQEKSFLFIVMIRELYLGASIIDFEYNKVQLQWPYRTRCI